jgi:hypothetical protein
MKTLENRKKEIFQFYWGMNDVKGALENTEPEGTRGILIDELMAADDEWLTEETEFKEIWPTGCGHKGIAARAAIHKNQMIKMTSTNLYTHSLVIMTGYETVSTGILMFLWCQPCGERQGWGVLPFWRYRTARGSATTHWSIEEATTASRNQVHPHLVPYVGRMKKVNPYGEKVAPAVYKVTNLIAAIQPFLFGHVRNSPGRVVWSQGDPARWTILEALKELNTQDYFWAPEKGTELILDAPSGAPA